MLQQSERISFAVGAKQKFFTGGVIGLTLLVMVGWVYFLGSIFLRLVLWLFF
jgi:hypothetical protein